MNSIGEHPRKPFVDVDLKMIHTPVTGFQIWCNGTWSHASKVDPRASGRGSFFSCGTHRRAHSQAEDRLPAGVSATPRVFRLVLDPLFLESRYLVQVRKMSQGALRTGHTTIDTYIRQGRSKIVSAPISMYQLSSCNSGRNGFPKQGPAAKCVPCSQGPPFLGRGQVGTGACEFTAYTRGTCAVFIGLVVLG